MAYDEQIYAITNGTNRIFDENALEILKSWFLQFFILKHLKSVSKKYDLKHKF